jgi:pimeloyl-ACP methyl ester carboxylesterase
MNHRVPHSLLAACLATCLAWSPCHARDQTAAAKHGDTTALESAPEKDRASMETMQIPSHGKLMNALVYVAAGAGPHPAVILLHGFPGNERNLDLAQDMRRAGWDVLYFNYRGSWGTPGDFSFAHGIEDTASAIAYLRQPDVAKTLRLDPTRIVLIGHSMGGFMTVQGAAADPAIKAFATISAADLASYAQVLVRKDGEAAGIKSMSSGLANEGMAPLNGCTPEGLARELVDRAADWIFSSKVDALKNRTALIVTSDDGLAPANLAFAADLRKAGDTHVSTVHLPTDHAYSDQRIELSKAVLKWLAGLPK